MGVSGIRMICTTNNMYNSNYVGGGIGVDVF